MKVIGINSKDDTCLVKVGMRELASIMGFYSEHDAEFKEQLNSALLGNSINVSKVYANYYKVKNIIEGTPYCTALVKLNEMIDAIKPINNLIKEVKDTYEAD